MVQQIPQSGLSENFPFRNIFINGDMSIAQRATSATGLTGSSYPTIDRMSMQAASAGTWTQSQSTDVPTGEGFAKSLKMDCTTANGSLSSGSYLIIDQRFEGQMLQHLKKGTSNAQKVTLSFFVKSAKTGTYIVNIRDDDNTRNISKSYTISSADTWEKKVLVFDADTSGALDNDNAQSFAVLFFLAAGSDRSSGTLATSWESTTNANRAVGQVNLADSTDNDWYLTGVQLEVGDTASDFEHLPFDVNLTRCQRYFEVMADGRSAGTGTLSSGDSDEDFPGTSVNLTDRYSYMPLKFATTKRSAAPSLLTTNDTNHFRLYSDNSNDQLSTVLNAGTSSHHNLTIYFDYGSSSGWAQGSAAFCRLNNANAFVMVKDEL
tara:strand:- start:58 stop:1188 length:1131 start_codon:yes stop_codon:yes gene_type:complete